MRTAVVHRDIKPENILLDRQGRVKVADFGLAKLVGAEPLTRPSASALRATADEPDTLSPSDGARDKVRGDSDTLSPSDGERAGVRGELALTDAGKVMGTPAYMAPEQRLRPTEVDHRADIYSLGVVFYQMLTGELPGPRIEPPSRTVRIDVRLDGVVLRALEEEPRRRYQHASEVKADLETITGTPVAGAATAAAASPSGATRRRGPAQLSQKAVIGAVWAPFFIFPLLVLFVYRVLLAGTPPRPEWWQSLLMGVLLPLGITAPFGTTLLGAIALSQIRRSAGRLSGLGLALFDTLCFPLLALDALIVCLVVLMIQTVARNAAIDSPPFITALAIVVCVAVDVMIVIWAWRAANKPMRAPSESRALATRRAAKIGFAVGGLTFLAVAVITFLLPQSFVSTARIVVYPPLSGAFSTNNLMAAQMMLRYGLVQDGSEMIRSATVLTNVIARLGLDERWGRRLGAGMRLKDYEALALLNERLIVRRTGWFSVTSSASMIEIGFSSEDRTEAAEIANAIAESCQTAETGRRVEIVDPAVPSLRPVRPNVTLNLSVGALVGLVLGGLASGFGASGLAWFLVPPVLFTWFLLFGSRVFGVDLDADERFWCGVIGLPATAAFGALLTAAMRLLKKTEPGRSATPAAWSWLSIAAMAVLVLSLPLGGGTMVMGQLIAQDGDWNPSSGELVFTQIFGAGTGLLAAASVLLGLAARRQLRGMEHPLYGGWGALAATWFWPCLASATLAFGLVHGAALPTPATKVSDREGELRMAWLAQLELAKAAAAAQRFTFGPVIERVINDPDDDTHNILLDLDSGRMMDCPVPWPKSSASRTEWQTALQAVREAAEREGMDALGDASGASLSVFRLAVVRVGPDDFDKITAASVRAHAALAGRELQDQTLTVTNPPATFWFKTSAGATGLLQVTGFTENPRAVKLRYKLTQPSVPAAAQGAAAAAFGPVIEQVLPCSAPCRMQYFQFHTGQVIAIGDGPGDTSDHAEDYRRAEESGGIDASVIGGKEGIQLAGKGCVFTQDKSPDWDATTAEVVVRTLQRESWLSGVVEIKAKDFPATYLFKTARGECGILQILGVTDEPPGWNQVGMKFRYKLVHLPGDDSPQAQP